MDVLQNFLALKIMMNEATTRERNTPQKETRLTLILLPIMDEITQKERQTNTTFNKIEMKDLKETATMMASADYKERFKAEYFQLKTRYDKLRAMVEKWDNGTLEFTPTSSRAIYDFQLRAMKDYLGTLQIRAELEGVDIAIGES